MNSNFLVKQILKNKNNNKIIFKDKYNDISWKQLIKLSLLNKDNLDKKNDKNVVIICGRNIDTVIAIISSILSGKTFCPISDKTPKKRIRFILNKLKTEILINASSEKFDKDLSCINIKKKFKKIKKFNKKKIVNSKNKICYILFTSGSTGEPKGVMLSYSNLLNTILWSKKYLKWNRKDLIGIATSFSFDISMFDLLTSIYFNVRAYIFSNTQNPVITYNEIVKKNVTSIFSVPSFFSNFIYFNLINKNFNKLRRIISGGDFFSPKSIKVWKDNQKKIEIFNVWGPTETSIVNTMHRIRKSEVDQILKSMSVPVGTSDKKMEVKIFKNKKFFDTPGIKGEICMFGKCVSEGYVGNIKENNKYIIHKNKRGFLTGDFGYFDKNKNLYLIGRKDTTVKVSGYRVDLKEIETISNNMEDVEDSKVLFIKDKEFNYIAIFILIKKKSIKKKFKYLLSQELPNYAMPKKIFFFKSFPKNFNGKVDIKKLEKLAKF